MKTLLQCNVGIFRLDPQVIISHPAMEEAAIVQSA
jgi:hypothetical protein